MSTFTRIKLLVPTFAIFGFLTGPRVATNLIITPVGTSPSFARATSWCSVLYAIAIPPRASPVYGLGTSMTFLLVTLHGKAKRAVNAAIFLPKLSVLSMYGSGQIKSITIFRRPLRLTCSAKLQPSSSYSMLRLTPMFVMSALPVYFGLKNLITFCRFAALFFMSLKAASMCIGRACIFLPSTVTPSTSALSDVLNDISEDSSPVTFVMSRSEPGPIDRVRPLHVSTILIVKLFILLDTSD